MLEKEFVPYQPSFDMKELGFDEPCFGNYKKTHKELEKSFYCYNSDYVDYNEDYIAAPLYQQAFRWFREKHNLMFQIFYLHNGNHAVIIHKTTPEYMDLVDQLRVSSGCVAEVPDCYSYEEAELECLKKLIEIIKK